MLVSSDVFLALGVALLGICTLALMLKLVILGLALDDWFELRNADKLLPERMVAQDDVVGGIGRVINIIMSTAVALTWVVIALKLQVGIVQISPVSIVVALAVIVQSVLACWQGIRGLLFRRKLARVIYNRRRAQAMTREDA